VSTLCLSAIAVVSHNCSGAVWSRTLLRTAAVVTPHGLVPTLSVTTGYATKHDVYTSFAGFQPTKRVTDSVLPPPNIQSVSGGMVNILGAGSIDYSE
jgi:hypothetical protein